ncbi:CHAT domain-containing protein [Nodosilinea sp. LEGE 07088]|uniref:CHAT domain-containing protein n=1 Tax=Nodosilinea sp. LEGE 07088 TaxID=2777968 RepID=UPI001881C77F|nr:CHAT domain-containing tetratricopeptide repeat protein [Nodosilinea sp. LEGE 07088]MBE9137733.1 CHAT domain-containing protein [Nodosilinea sp. LEGE 07088]
MRNPIRLLRLAAATALAVLAIQMPGFSGEFWDISPSPTATTLAQAEAASDRKAEADRLLVQGDQQYGVSQFREALQSFEQALAIYREIGDRQGEAAALGRLGNPYHYLGQYERAIDVLQQALVISQEIDYGRGEAAALGNLGNLYASLGQYERAIDVLQQALTIAREMGNRRGEAAALSSLGLVHASLGQHERAIDLHQQALAIFHEIGDRRDEAAALNNLSAAHTFLFQYERAIDLNQQALAIFHEIGDRDGEAAALSILGTTFYFQGQFERAIDFYQQALSINREIGNSVGEANALANQGSILIWLKQLPEAELVLRQAIEIFESLRIDLTDDQLISIADIQAEAYVNLMGALVLQKQPTEALAVAERGRARAFVLLLSSRLSDPDRADLAATEAPTIDNIQQIARDTDTTLVTYSLFLNKFIHIWVVQPSGDIAFRIVELQSSDDSGVAVDPIATLEGPLYRQAGNESELTELVADSRAGVRESRAEPPTAQLQALHRVLIDPIAEFLPTDPEAKVVFIPQGSLFLVPFSALQDENGTYLIEQHTILTAPSIQVFGLASAMGQTAENGVPQTPEALVVGDPVMPSVWLPEANQEVQLTSLPGAREEAEAIGELLGRSPLTGNEATESHIKQVLPSADLIHLATHGLLEYGNPETSGVLDLPGAVALAPGDGEDGLLTAAEILEMDLQADLAVLSACDTGRGRITGDGVVGLSRALITAGVPSVVVSLWAVPDAPTAALMTEFYRQLDAGQDKSQALRQAMLSTMERHPNPRDWAAFTLLGASE